MASKDEPDKKKDSFLEWLEETDDPFGLEEEIETITFTCIDCKKEDEVPDFVVDEFAYDLEEGEEVEVVCPFCNGTMRSSVKNTPSS